MSHVRILKKLKKMGDVYILLCLRSAELSKAFGLKNLWYSKISVVILLGYRIAGISRKVRTKNALRPNATNLNSLCHTCLVQKKI